VLNDFPAVQEFLMETFLQVFQFTVRFSAFLLLFALLPKPRADAPGKNFTRAHPRYVNDELKADLLFVFSNKMLAYPVIGVITLAMMDTLVTPYFPAKIFEAQVQRMPLPMQIFLGVFVLDLALFARHSFVHHYAWPFHSVHHAAKQISWLTWSTPWCFTSSASRLREFPTPSE
jgi:sterol desaturase/sphingolipid hydroxylase (fatty acid hydroxylase superfamily)